MSKIITIFSNPGTYGADTEFSVSDKIASAQHLTAEGHVTNEANFDKPRHVGSIFNAIRNGKHTYQTAHNIGIVSDDADAERGAIKELSDALTKMYGITAGNAIIGSVEVSDAQMGYLEANSQAMQVFIDNAIVNADSLAWGDNDVDNRDNMVKALNDATNDVDGLIDTATQAAYEDDWDEDDWDEDWDDEDWDDDNFYSPVSFDDEDEDEGEGEHLLIDVIDDDDINPRAQVIVMSREDLEKFKRDNNL